MTSVAIQFGQGRVPAANGCRITVTRNKNVSRTAGGNGVCIVVVAVAQIGGPLHVRPVVDSRDIPIDTAVIDVRGIGQIARQGVTGNEDVACAVNGDPPCIVAVAAAQVHGPSHGTPAADFGDKAILVSPLEFVESVCEVWRVRVTSHEHVLAAVDRDRGIQGCIVAAGAAQIRGPNHVTCSVNSDDKRVLRSALETVRGIWEVL